MRLCFNKGNDGFFNIAYEKRNMFSIFENGEKCLLRQNQNQVTEKQI